MMISLKSNGDGAFNAEYKILAMNHRLMLLKN
jgi:hypothetical protein